jgi:hypothetical protein
VRQAAHNGAYADRDKESVMHPTSQTEMIQTEMIQTEIIKTRAGARPRPARPNCAPAYYLARPASVWITATTRYAGAPDAGL